MSQCAALYRLTARCITICTGPHVNEVKYYAVILCIVHAVTCHHTCVHTHAYPHIPTYTILCYIPSRRLHSTLHLKLHVAIGVTVHLHSICILLTYIHADVHIHTYTYTYRQTDRRQHRAHEHKHTLNSLEL